jgi:hypothetical protein
VISPSKEFEDTSRTWSIDNSATLLVKLSFNQFLDRYNSLKKENFVRSE